MPNGPGKYDDYCTRVREETDAHAAIVLVIGGKRGSGFSVQSEGYGLPAAVLAALLHQMADEIGRSGAAT
jgi:hypothetical protein